MGEGLHRLGRNSAETVKSSGTGGASANDNRASSSRRTICDIKQGRRENIRSNENKVSDGGHRRKTIRRECVTIALGSQELDEIQEGAWLA